MTKPEPSRNPSLKKKYFYDFEAPEKKEAQPGGEAASKTACAVGAFIGLHGQKCILKNSDLAWVNKEG
jgi:hypothetical protein